MTERAASLGVVRDELRAAVGEPHEPAVDSLVDALIELVEYVEQQQQKGSDARAQLWARVYAAEFEACRGFGHGYDIAHESARNTAKQAVRNFDVDYLGSDPRTRTKG